MRIQTLLTTTLLLLIHSAVAQTNTTQYQVVWKKVETNIKDHILQNLPNPQAFLQNISKTVEETLYFEKEPRRAVHSIRLVFKPFDGVAAKSNAGADVTIDFSTKWANKVLDESGADALKAELRGVLLHEITHAWQLEPQGIGNYSNSKVFWAFIEGMADAVRRSNGGFNTTSSKPAPNATYLDGYQTTGNFLVWVQNQYDPDFLRKMNSSTRILAEQSKPWSFDLAVKFSLGQEHSIDALWASYLQSFENSVK